MNGTVFKYRLFVFSICFYCSSVCTLSNKFYNFLYRYVRVTSITKTCIQHHGIKFDLTICVVCSRLIIIHVDPVFCSEFYDWLSVLSSILWSSGTPFFLYIYQYNNHISETIFCHFSGGLYVSLGVLVGSGICVDFFFSLWALFEVAFAIYSGILFSNRSSVASAIC